MSRPRGRVFPALFRNESHQWVFDTFKPHLNQWFSKCVPWVSSISNIWGLIRYADLLNQKIYLNKIPRWFVSTLKFERC